MTVRLRVTVEPVDEAVSVTVVGERDGKQMFYQQFETPTILTSNSIPVEYGDRIQVAVETGKKIVLDNEQFVARMEDPDKGEIKAEREGKEKAEKEAVEKHQEDSKKRAENAKKLEQKFRKEADEQEVPSKAPPFPAPLDIEGEEEKDKREPHPTGGGPERASATPRHPVPPRGGAMDSREVKK